MSRVVFLPRAEAPENDWQQTGPVFRLNSGDIRVNLAPAKRLSAEGIPSPWAARDFMKWCLEDQKSVTGRHAAKILRTLVLLSFLRLIDGTEITLTEGPEGIERLGRVLLRPGNSPDTKLVIWKSNRPELAKYRVVACSVATCLFFPAADMDPADLDRTLIASFGPASQHPVVDANGNVTDAKLAGDLGTYLDRLRLSMQRDDSSLSHLVNALDIWINELKRFGAAPSPNAILSISLGDSGDHQLNLEAWGGSTSWNCRQCQREGTLWMNLPPGGGQVGRVIARITIDECSIRCLGHTGEHVRSNDGYGDPIKYADLGCYPGEQLYIWNEQSAFPENRSGPPRIGDGFIEHQFNLFWIRIEGKLIKLTDVILDPKTVAWPSRGVPRTADGNELRESPSPIDVPVYAEYASLIKESRFDPAKREWILSLHGYPSDIFRSAPLVPPSRLWETSTILVWPPQENDEWAVDYIVASAPLSSNLRFRTITQAPGGAKYDISKPRKLLGLYRTEAARIRYVELGDITTGTYRSLGLMKVTRPLVSAYPATRAEVVVDFGTSNSAVLWKLPDRQPRFFRSGIEESTLAEQACLVTYSPKERTELESAAAILLSWYPEKQNQPFVPALLAEPDRDHPEGQPCIPPRKEGVKILRQSGKDIATSRVQVGLKWRDWSDPITRKRVTSLVEALLIPALWELSANRVKQWILKVTYPLAFERTESFDRKAMYGAIIEELLTRLCDSEKTIPRPDSLQFFSESLAGAASLQQPNSTFEITLDLGGGTLDLAILVGPAGSEICGLPAGKVVAADSLEYGGRDFLRAIVSAYGPHLLIEGPSDKNATDEHIAAVRLEQLEYDLHNGGIKGLLERLNNADMAAGASADQDRKWRWEALLAGISLYVRRLLEGVISKYVLPLNGRRPSLTVGFFLLGQGWQLLRLRYPNADIRTIMQEPLTNVCTKASENTQVSIGRPTIQAPSGDLDPKTAVVLGALELEASDNVQPNASFVHTGDDGDVRQTFLGMKLGANGNIIEPTESLSDLSKDRRPSESGDPGYAALIEDLWDEIPQAKRADIRKWFLTSRSFRNAHTADSVEAALILMGESSFVRHWPPDGRPRLSLLGAFLSEVWRTAWTEYSLK
jgi:hypothetical protein